MANVFSVQVFFICFRECLEATIIISVLLSFLKKAMGNPDQDVALYKRLVRQVWIGTFAGVFLCLVIGGAFIGTFYTLGKDVWASSEDLWEGIFYLIATIIITFMGFALLRVNKMQDKWRVKIAQAIMDRKNKEGSAISRWATRYAMALLPFVTTLREGVEAVVFVGGVSLGLPGTAFPIPVITGLLSGVVVGFLIYRGGNVMALQYFLIASTSVLYLIAAGLFSKAIWSLQFHVFAVQVGSDVAEVGSGPGSYNINQSVWHVNCCNPEIDNGWDIFNAILGWTNSATYGSVISYCIYWLFVILVIIVLLYEERTGSLPFKNSILQSLLKVPGLNKWAAKKIEKSDAEKKAIIEQAETAGIFAVTGATTTTEPYRDDIEMTSKSAKIDATAVH